MAQIILKGMWSEKLTSLNSDYKPNIIHVCSNHDVHTVCYGYIPVQSTDFAQASSSFVPNYVRYTKNSWQLI